MRLTTARTRPDDPLRALTFHGAGDIRCESVLDAEWSRWEQLEALPELVQGRYGPLLVGAHGMELDIEWITGEMTMARSARSPGPTTSAPSSRSAT